MQRFITSLLTHFNCRLVACIETLSHDLTITQLHSAIFSYPGCGNVKVQLSSRKVNNPSNSLDNMATVVSDFGTLRNIPGEHLCSECSKLNLQKYLAPVTLRRFWDLPDIVSFDRDLQVSPSAECSLCRLLSSSLSPGRIAIPEQIKTIKFEELGQTETLSGISTASLCIGPCRNGSQRLAPYGRDSYKFGARRYTYGRIV
jgi:hypothetical protein